MASLPNHKILLLAKRLDIWFQENQRPLPWRLTKNPYRIWISEIMLQQTQVATVIPFYLRWLREFPSVKNVATAPLSRLFKMWEGLGYYSRAKNIHRAACEITKNQNGKFPSSLEEIRKLPGVGPYTAGAIASIAFGIQTPLLDGNVMRVLTRLFAIASPIDSPSTWKKLWVLAGRLVPKSRPGDFNQALMELGATVCLARSPLCGSCPVSRLCASFSTGRQLSFPVKGKKQVPQKVTAACVMIKCRKKILVEQRPETGLWAGLWQLPTFSGRGPVTSQSIENGLKQFGITASNIRRAGKLQRSYTSHRETLHIFKAETARLSDGRGTKLCWASRRQLEKLPFPAAHKKIIETYFPGISDEA